MRIALESLVVLMTLALTQSVSLDIGTVDKTKAPSAEEVRPPTHDDGIATVGLHATIKGTVRNAESRHVYVLISPVSNEQTRGRWWVQNDVSRKKDAIECDCQFGEEDAGRDEYFAIVAVVCDASHAVGDVLDKLPEKAAFSKLRIVKRK